MEHSAEIDKLAAALAKAQAQMGGAIRDSSNPFFHSKYADLQSVWDACRKPLTDNGLCVVQSPGSEDSRIVVETMLLHESGQWMRGVIGVTPKDAGPQAAGSCITYLKRYALQSFAGIAPEDDDGNAAEGKSKAPVAKAAPEALPPVALPPLKKASDLTLTEAQQTRLKALMKEHGVKASAVKALVEQTYSIKTAADIRQASYDDLCAWVAGVGDGHE